MREKLPFLTKFFYGFGSLAYGIKDNAFNYFLLFVYVQVFGLAPNLAGLAILLTVLGYNLLGEGLRDLMDPKNNN